MAEQSTQLSSCYYDIQRMVEVLVTKTTNVLFICTLSKVGEGLQSIYVTLNKKPSNLEMLINVDEYPIINPRKMYQEFTLI